MRSRNGGRRRLGRNLRRDLWMLLSLLERQQRSCDGNGKDHVWLELNQFFGKGGQSILVATRRPINNIKVLIFYVTEFSLIRIGEDQPGTRCTAGLQPTSCRLGVISRHSSSPSGCPLCPGEFNWSAQHLLIL